MPRTILQALMEFNRLGVSSNKRDIMAGVVRLNGELVHFTDTAVLPGDKVRVGKRQEFVVGP